MLQGFDCSHRIINVDKIKGKYDFVGLKGTEGLTVLDSTMKPNLAALRGAKIVPIVYHFIHPKDDFKKQAEFLIEAVGDGPVILAGDFEWTKTDTRPEEWDDIPVGGWSFMAEDFLDQIVMTLRRKPLVYGVPSFLDKYLPSVAWGVYGGLWKCKLEAQIPTGWPQFAIEQYSFDGVIDGVPGKVDLDRSPFALEKLQAMAGM